jgi:antitoxin MazE
MSNWRFSLRVAKWGNSLAVRLPVALVQELGIADGDELLLQPLPHQVKRPATLTVARQPGKLEQLQAIRSLRAPGRLILRLTATRLTRGRGKDRPHPLAAP